MIALSLAFPALLVLCGLVGVIRNNREIRRRERHAERLRRALDRLSEEWRTA
jgi:type II secretory pathway component PulJ